MIEIAVGEYDMDMTKLMAAATKKMHEERDKYYMNNITNTNCIRAGWFIFNDFIHIKYSSLNILVIISADNQKRYVNDKLTVYEFDTENNNVDSSPHSEYKVARSIKDDNKKFRMAKCNEGASVLKQFIVLFDRNFKASSRNAVNN